MNLIRYVIGEKEEEKLNKDLKEAYYQGKHYKIDFFNFNKE